MYPFCAKRDFHLNMYRMHSVFVYLLSIYLFSPSLRRWWGGVSVITRTSYNFSFSSHHFSCSAPVFLCAICKLLSATPGSHVFVFALFLSFAYSIQSIRRAGFCHHCRCVIIVVVVFFLCKSTLQNGQAKHRTKVLIRNTLFASRVPFFAVFCTHRWWASNWKIKYLIFVVWQQNNEHCTGASRTDASSKEIAMMASTGKDKKVNTKENAPDKRMTKLY